LNFSHRISIERRRKLSKRQMTAVVLLIVVSVACYGQSKYGDIEELFEWYAEELHNLADVLEASEDPKEVAAALNEYVDATLKFIPQMQKFEEKYPELEEMPDPPPELEPSVNRFEEATKRLSGSFGSLSRFADDPDVQKALARLQELEGM